MKTRVTVEGVTIPAEWFHGIDEVEIRRENGAVVVVPVRSEDPINLLGKHTVDDPLTDGSVKTDSYVYGGG